MIISLSEVCMTPGEVKSLECPLELENLKFNGNSYKITNKPPMHLNITALSKTSVSIKGNADYTINIPCSRCLEDVACEVNCDIDLEYDLNGSYDEEMAYIEGNSLNTDSLIAEELMLNLPDKVLCMEDCAGLCPVCGKNLNRSKCDCDTFVPDPRMAAIQDIFKNFKEV
ncbi:MAG: DUF177 domain-containing protein [Lachnospiraceae bacterium]|nr:DUF177 domain-containing protein [Lachnospiraceae bacterium]